MLVYLQLLDTAVERDLFTRLYQEHRAVMLNRAEKILNASGWAEDAVQDAFFKIAEQIHLFVGKPYREQRYLCVAIVRNIALNLLHKNERYDLSEESEFSPFVTQEDTRFLRADQMIVLKQAIRTLDDLSRDVLILRTFEGYTTKETSVLLGISEGDVRIRLYRARKKLMEELRNE